jgi:glycosyltransferase involved in cell wall biosynthesis
MTESPPVLHRGNVAAVIPALDEALRIREVVLAAMAECDLVIVIDDGSSDDTAAIVATLPVVLLRHAQRTGKGQALRDGFAEALRRGMAAVVTMDGDGQHRASDIPRLIAAANAHPGNIVNGARLKKRSTQPWYRRLGNDFGDWGIAWGCGFRLFDSQSGQRLYPAAVMALDDVPGDGVVSVPVETRYAVAGGSEQFRKSHFRLFRDLYRITSHVVAQVLANGRVVQAYRQCRARPPVVFDPGTTPPEA